MTYNEMLKKDSALTKEEYEKIVSYQNELEESRKAVAEEFEKDCSELGFLQAILKRFQEPKDE